MYKRATYRIRSNEPLTETVYRMVVEGDTQYLTAPGQFVNIELPGPVSPQTHFGVRLRRAYDNAYL